MTDAGVDFEVEDSIVLFILCHHVTEGLEEVSYDFCAFFGVTAPVGFYGGLMLIFVRSFHRSTFDFGGFIRATIFFVVLGVESSVKGGI